MSAILKVDLKKKKEIRFSEVNYQTYTKTPNFACDNYISLKQGETTTNSGPIPHPFNGLTINPSR